MRKRILFQIFVLIFHHRVTGAYFSELGNLFSSKKEPEEPKRIRIYLDDNEALVVPKNSKVEYINPVIELAEVPNTPNQAANPIHTSASEVSVKSLPPATIPVGQQSAVHQYHADQEYNQHEYVEQQPYYGDQQYESGYQQQYTQLGSQPYENYINQQYKTIQNYENFGNKPYNNEGYSHYLPNVATQDYQGFHGDLGYNNLEYGQHSVRSVPTQIRIDGFPPKYKLEELRLSSNALHYGDFQSNSLHRGGRVGISSVQKNSPIAFGKLLKPILLLPNGYIQGVELEKPVEEDHSGDLKYDFRTKTHSI